MSSTGAERRKNNLGRTLKPTSIAVVGLKDSSPFVLGMRQSMDSDAEVWFVNPNHPTVLGRPTVPTLADIGKPVDVVYCVTNAVVATTVVEEAARLGCGGVVLISGGFAEMDEAGVDLQNRLLAAASTADMHVVGPNGIGFVNVNRQISLAISSPYKRRPGGISIVSQSGAMLSGATMSAWGRPQVGLNVLVSAGNEAVTDLADYLDYLVDDPETTAIGLVVESIRRPKEFFAAARRAILAGKPIVALKLARSSRTQALAASHTGAMTGDAWVYDVAFKQLGIGIAHDPDELIDRLALIEQLDEKYWNRIENLAIITATGGFASMATDIADFEGVNVPQLEELRPWVAENIPGISIPNPLDATGFGMGKWDEILERYAGSPQVDALLFVHPLDEEDESDSATSYVQRYVDAAARVGKPVLLSNCAGPLGVWAQRLVEEVPGAATASGPRAVLRGLRSLGDFVKARERLTLETAAPPSCVARPTAAPVPQPEGAMLPFSASVALLGEHGIPVAPHHLIADGAEITLPEFGAPYVVKLADVAHRTEHGAVKLGITSQGLTAAVAELREIAAAEHLAPLVVVQPMVASRGEAFLGIQNTELGPMVVFGLGGIFVEVLKRVGGRMAPYTRAEAESLIAEFEGDKLMHGFRGLPPWPLDALADLLVSVGQLAAGSADWLQSLDVNPLLVTDDGFLAVDVLALVRDAGA